MPEDLHQRYMAAARVYREHSDDCGRCTTITPQCDEGRRLYGRFAQAQDAYLARQRAQQRRR